MRFTSQRSWCFLIQNVYRRSLSSGPEFTKTLSFRDPRPARTPPSTFLFLHLHLSNSPGPETPPPVGRKGSQSSVSTANDNRLGSVVTSLIKMRSFTGAKTCLGLWANAAPRSVGGL